MTSVVELGALGVEICRVLAVLPEVERGRRTRGPRPLVADLRRKARQARARSPRDRARLQRAIAWVDACFPGGGNCYRRALLEMALDRGAASEPLRMGLKAGGGRGSGHAWL